MPDLVEQMYCSQQITVPPNLSTILKKYAKAAIRTQPQDLLVWSAYYFKALTYGIPLPVKERLEYPPVQTISGLSPGFIKILINQLGNEHVKVLKIDIIDYWSGVCLSREALEEILAVGGFGEEVNWLKFIAICTGYLETCLTRTMILLCDLFTEEPPGGSAHLPVNKFLYLYKFLARLDCGSEEPKTSSTPRLMQESSISEDWSEEEISYKDGEGKSGSILSWQSVLQRMGKRESEKSTSTVDIDKVYNKEDALSRGIAWKQIKEIEESSEASLLSMSDNLGSTMGLQVFECHEDKLKKIKLTKVEEGEEEGVEEQECEEDEEDEEAVEDGEEGEGGGDKDRDLSQAKATTSLLKGVGEKSLNEMLEHMQDYEITKNIKEAAESSDQVSTKSDSSLHLEDEKLSPKFKTCTIITPPSSMEKFAGEPKEADKTDYEIRVLLKRDSSTILVPTPPNEDNEYDMCLDDIKELEEEEILSTGEPLGQKVAISLFDVRVPQIYIPTLMKVDEKEVPQKIVLVQKWVHIPGIGPRVSEAQITQVEDYMRECALKQGGAVMPRNIRHFLCPPLDPQ